MESLDNILSGNGEATPKPEPTQVEETTATEVAVKEPSSQDEPQDEVIENNGRKMVPLEALTETRGKVKRYTEEVADFRKQLAESNAAWERRMQDVLQAVRPQQQVQEPQPAPDFFADPDAAIRAAFEQNLAPLHSQLNETRTALLEERLTRLAGSEKVTKIEAELRKAMDAGDPEIQVLQNAIRTKGPAAASLLVEWFDKRAFDPEAEREKMKAEILAELQAGKPQQPTTTVMPSNIAGARNVGTRAGPAWSGPPTLQDIFNRKTPGT